MKQRIALYMIFVCAILISQKTTAQVVIRDSVTISSAPEYFKINSSDSSFLANPEMLTAGSTHYLPCGPFPPSYEDLSFCSITYNVVKFYGDSMAVGINMPTLQCNIPWSDFDYFYSIYGDQCGTYNECRGVWRQFTSLRDVHFIEGTEYIRIVDRNTRNEVGHTLHGLYMPQNQNQYIIYFDKQELQEDSVIVAYEFTNPNIGDRARVNFIVVQPQFAVQTNVGFSQARHGETRAFSFDAFNQCRLKFPTYVQYRSPLLPDTVTYDVSIIAGSEFGILRNTQTGETGITLNGLTHNQGLLSSISFVANGQQPLPLADNEVLIQVGTSDSRIEPVVFPIQILPDDLHHFEVTVQPDTIAHNETAIIYVQAKDIGDNYIQISDGTLLDFSLDASGELLGNLIAPNGSQAKSLAGISYGDARVGRVRYIANGARPDSTQRVSVTVRKSDDASKQGTGGVVVEAFPKLVVEIPDPNEIWPTLPAGRSGGNPQNRNLKESITMTVTKNNQPMANQSVKITAQIVARSGGHDHVDQPPSDSLGVFRDSIRTERGSMTRATDSSGKISFSYQAPLFSGQMVLTAIAAIDVDTLVARDTVMVRVPDLAELAADTRYELIGAPGNHSGTNDPCRAVAPTSEHNRNHYGTQALRDAVQNIAAAYDSLHAGIRLRINDLSLEWGGLFDNLNNWRYVAGASHSEHRIGRNADIGFSGIDPNGGCAQLNLIDLRRFIRDYTTDTAYTHDDHYHIRMR